MSNINLINEIIGNIPEGLDDLEKLYYIYIETCKIFSYDTRYNDSSYIIGEVIKHNYQNITNIKETTIVCSVWARIFHQLLKKVRIKSVLVGRNGHFWVESYVNNMIIYSDPTYGNYNDFARVRHNDSIHHFYAVTLEETDRLPIIDAKANFNIDKLNEKIGYVVKEKETFKNIEEKLINVDSLKDKVDCILKNATLVHDDYFSDWQYLKNLLRVLLHNYHTNITYGTLTKVNDDYTFNYKDLIIVEEKENYYYYLFDNEINEVSKEELFKNANLGYGIRPLYKDVNLNYPLKFKVPKTSLHYFLNIMGFKNKEKEKCYNKTRW